jgi:hypothetical protein
VTFLPIRASDGEKGAEDSHAAFASLDGAFAVTPGDVEDFMRFAAASGGFSIW